MKEIAGEMKNGQEIELKTQDTERKK